MGAERQNFAIDAAASMLGWWRDAGVDAVMGETPRDWLGAETPVRAAAVETPAVTAVPQSLNGLVEHLMTADLPDAGPPRRRLAPAGNLSPALMILVDFPDPADVEAGTLLSDPLFDKMLAALGEARDTVYIAALCPGRPITGRLSAESIEALADLAGSHLALIAPRKLWLVGTAASRALLGMTDAEAKGQLHFVNHPGGIIETIATAHPRMFDRSTGSKAAAWAEMQRLKTGPAA